MKNLLFDVDPKYADANPNDVVFTPPLIAAYIVELFKPNGKILDPCRGAGAFYNCLPEGSDWCEVTEGKNFYDYKEKVDWIISNPPYSDFDLFLEHSFEIADNVVYLVPIAKVFKSWGIMSQIRNYGGIVAAWFTPAGRCGFPFGFPAGAFAGNKVAMFLKTLFVESAGRKELFKNHPPKTIYVSSSRLACAKNGVFDKDTSRSVSYSWFIWEKGYKGETVIKWFN